jgi:hypothetical protein
MNHRQPELIEPNLFTPLPDPKSLRVLALVTFFFARRPGERRGLEEGFSQIYIPLSLNSHCELMCGDSDGDVDKKRTKKQSDGGAGSEQPPPPPRADNPTAAPPPSGPTAGAAPDVSAPAAPAPVLAPVPVEKPAPSAEHGEDSGAKYYSDDKSDKAESYASSSS